MKAQLIVVQGKPEGKVIPLAGPKFKIGRGETCHLRPGSEQVSREHAEFTITADSVTVRDLGSRNGTLVNGKALTEPCVLKDRDLVQVGPLTFALSLQGAAAPKPAGSPASKGAEDVSHDDIESWLVADSKSPVPDRPSGVYGGDTITISAFKDTTAKPPAPAVSDEDSDEEYERQAEDDEEEEPVEEEVSATAETEEMPEDLVDESNPFYVKKKTPDVPAKPTYKDTSDAATDILKKMMERRRSSR
jgi:pSer/pThr/pTyr-binding forkhead associated (FHA) protein